MERYISCIAVLHLDLLIFVFTKKYKTATMMPTLIKERNMPVGRRWYVFNREKVSELRTDMLGIYFLGDKDKIPVYIGSSERSNIRGRLLAHKRNNRCPKAKYFRYTIASAFDNPKQMESLAIFSHVRKYKKFPIYIKAFPKLAIPPTF